MFATLLACALLAPPAPAASSPPAPRGEPSGATIPHELTEPGETTDAIPGHRDCDDALLPALRVPSSRPARLRLVVYVDPLADELLTTWHRAQRIAGTAEGELDVELRIVRRELATTALERDVEHFAALALAALASPARTPDVERISHFIQRHGVRGVAATMRRAELRVRAEQALGLPEGTLSPADEARRCLQARLDHDTQRIVDQQRALSGGLRTQPPWVSIALDDVTVAWWSDDRGLRETPVHVDAWRRALRSGDPPSPSHDLARPTAPRAATTSTAGTMRVVPPSRGLRIGGAGLAHEAVVILGNESDPALQWALPKLLALREAHLGQLAITVVARDTPEAALLATRLCAARRLDLAQPFLRALLAKVRRQASDEWERVSALVDA
jgi:hypothetical protein